MEITAIKGRDNCATHDRGILIQFLYSCNTKIIYYTIIFIAVIRVFTASLTDVI